MVCPLAWASASKIRSDVNSDSGAVGIPLGMYSDNPVNAGNRPTSPLNLS